MIIHLPIKFVLGFVWVRMFWLLKIAFGNVRVLWF
jgi:hypothetical protein